MYKATLIDQRPLTKATERLLAGAGAAAMIGGSAVVALFDPSRNNVYPVCPLFTATGIACPGCGLTRGFHSFFHGDFLTALGFNVLTPIWAIIFGWVLLSLLLIAIRGRGLPMWPTNPRVMWAFFIVLAVFGVLRNIPIWPLTFLYP